MALSAFTRRTGVKSCTYVGLVRYKRQRPAVGAVRALSAPSAEAVEYASRTSVATAEVQGGYPLNPRVLFLHGLMGSASNFRTLSHRVAASGAATSTCLDLPLHGKSPMRASREPIDIATLAEQVAAALDILELTEEGGIDIVGHSLGGKVAMAVAAMNPGVVRRLAVLDIGPLDYHKAATRRDSGVMETISAARNVDMDAMSSRRDVDQALLEGGITFAGTRQFVTQNVVKKDGGVAWRLDLECLVQSLPQLSEFIDRDAYAPVEGVDTLFVRGGKSDFLLDEDMDELEHWFPGCEVETVDGAGHWVHAERPDETFALFTEHFGH